jgi:hypothetical protein
MGGYLPDVQRFVGFVEGRLRVQVPEWWEGMLESPDKHHPSRTGAQTGQWRSFPRESGMNGTTMRLAVGSEEAAISAQTSRWLTEDGRNDEYFADVRGDYAIILSTPTAITRGRIACVRRKEGTERWRRDVWGTNQLTCGSSGPLTVAVDLVAFSISDGILTVFGARSYHLTDTTKPTFIHSALYVEQFAMADGKCNVRFATNNWGVLANEVLRSRMSEE